jgi:hypothetical protein
LNSNADTVATLKEIRTSLPNLSTYATISYVDNKFGNLNPSPVQIFNAPLIRSYEGGGEYALTIPQATTLKDGYLSSTDWNTFNNKSASNHTHTGLVTSASAPLSFSSNVLSISQATTSTNGYLSSTDWNTFNNKVSTGTLSLYVKEQLPEMSNTVKLYETTRLWNHSINPNNQTRLDIAINGNGKLTLNSNADTVATLKEIRSHTHNYAPINSNGQVSSNNGFVTQGQVGTGGSKSITYITGVTPTTYTMYYYDPNKGDDRQITVVTGINVTTATATLNFSGGLYTGSTGYANVEVKDNEINLTLEDFQKLENEAWKIDEEYLEFLEFKEWKKQQTKINNRNLTKMEK